MYKYVMIIAFSLALVLPVLDINAESALKIYTDRERYSFSDHLSFTLEVSEISDPFAVMHITDENGKRSSPINISITKSVTTLTAPNPFDRTIYSVGKYTIDLEYSGQTTSTDFILFDSGKTVIPIWIKDLTRFWLQDAINDDVFVQVIEYLIKENIIDIPETEAEGAEKQATIPLWVRTNAGWWVDGLISDDDFALGLQYLIKLGIIVV